MTWSRTRARAWRREVAARTCGATRRLERRAAGAARTARVTAAMASWVRAAARDEMGGRRCFGRRYPRQVEGFRDSEIRSRVSMPGPGVVVVAVAGCRFTSADRASLDPTRADTMSPASVERCVGEFRATLTRGALPSSECVSFGVSKGLSLGIVAGAVQNRFTGPGQREPHAPVTPQSVRLWQNAAAVEDPGECHGGHNASNGGAYRPVGGAMAHSRLSLQPRRVRGPTCADDFERVHSESEATAPEGHRHARDMRDRKRYELSLIHI